MEDLILDIAKELLAVSIGFVGLVFTSLSILMTLKDDNWKIAKLKKSQEFKNFIALNTNTVIGFVVLFIVSITFLALKKLSLFSDTLIYGLYIYLLYLIYLSFNICLIAYRYKQIIILMSDTTKPTLNKDS
ncbi:MAG: hypothetical protein OQK11_03705 [Thiovulaceae bacterium]|nr:hypothetical protein [Sulfurimonadaceae bacterium]